MPVFPWMRYEGDYTSSWPKPKKKPAKKAAAGTAKAAKKTRKSRTQS